MLYLAGPKLFFTSTKVTGMHNARFNMIFNISMIFNINTHQHSTYKHRALIVRRGRVSQ